MGNIISDPVGFFTRAERRTTGRNGPAASVSEVQAVRTCSPGMPDNGYLEKKNAVIGTLKKQLAELKAYRDQLTQQLGRNEKEKTENKINLQQVENTPWLLTEKEDLLKVTWKLDEQKIEYEKSRNHIDRLLQNIDNLLSIAAE